MIKTTLLLTLITISVYSELYSEWKIATTNSEKALLLSPSLFIDISNIEINQELIKEINAGIQYDFIKLYQGITLGKKIIEECNWYETCLEFEKIFEVGTNMGKLTPLEKKRESIFQLKDSINMKLASLDTLFKEGLITLDIITGFEDKLEKISLIELQLNIEIEKLKYLPKIDDIDLKILTDSYNDHDKRVEKHQANLRKSSAWSIMTLAGINLQYDQKIKIYPLGQIVINFNFGRLTQDIYNQQAQFYRNKWRERSPESYIIRINKLQDELKAIKTAIKQRLIEIEKNIAILKNRIHKLDPITNIKIRYYVILISIELSLYNIDKTYLSSLLYYSLR